MSAGRRLLPALALLAAAECALGQAAPVCTTETIGGDNFYGISGSSDSNVIGVGESGAIERFDGASWSGMISGTGEDLVDVHVVDDDTAFAVGDDGEVIEYTGFFTLWTDRGGFTNRDLYGVWAASESEAWVVGDQGGIWRWNGSSWNDESNAAGTSNRDVEDVHGDADYVYAISDRGELYIFDRNAGTWSSRVDACRQGNNFSDVWSDGAGNVYLTRREDIYRYDGASCQVVYTAGDWMNGIYGGGGQIWAGGRTGDVAQFTGSWTQDDVTDEDINDVWVSPSGTAWFGENGGQVTSCVTVQPNVIADWPLDDCTLGFDGSTVTDAGPNGLDGTANGGLAVENDGQLCSAGAFNGSSSYVRVPDSALLDTQDGFSVAVWLRHNGNPTNWEAILAKGDNSYRLHLNGGCEISDNLPGNTRYGFTLGLNGGCGGADLNSNVVPSPGVWYHVAATYDRSEMRIYINGSLVNFASYSSAINNSGYDVGIGENTQQRGRYWNGDIDELTLWDNAIGAQAVVDHMNRTRPCTNCSSVEFIVNHDGNGINCVDETIAVDVVDSISGTPRNDYSETVTLDTQTGFGTWTLVSGSGSFDDPTANDGLATYEWPLGEDQAVFALSYREGPSPFDVDVFQSNDTGVRDNDSEGQLTFNPSGFTVTAAPLTNPPPALIVPFSAPQTAGVAFPVYLAAFGQTANDPACGVIEAYDGDRDLQVWNDYVNPGTGSIAPTVDGLAVAASEAAAGTRTVTFTNGQASVTARYKDAGRIRLNFNDDGVSDPNLPDGIRGATAGFVSRPYSFVLSDIEDAGGNPNPGAAGAGGPAFVAAGAPFSATVAAVDADGDVTPNFGRESSPESVALAPGLVSPAGGDNPAISFATGFGAFAGGQATGSDFSWPEVGIVTLTPSILDGDYLGTGDVAGTPSGNVGRFYPDHFTAALNLPLFATACSTGGFTWLGEPFGYGVPPVATLTARATDGSVTENYSGAFFRLDNATLANRVYASTFGTLDASGIPAPAADPAVADLGNGIGTLTFDAGSGLRYARGSPEAPFAAEISLAIDVFDADGVAALSNPVTFGTGGGIGWSDGGEQRYGRVRLENAIGSELVNLAVPMRTEYYLDAATGFVPNPDDACSTGISLSLGGFTNNLAAGETCVIENGSPGQSGAACAASGPAGQRYREPPVAGDFNLWLQAPGEGNDGSATVTADVPAWLQFDWDAGVPGLENPAGTATFGIYRGEDRRIYLRELY